MARNVSICLGSTTPRPREEVEHEVGISIRRSRRPRAQRLQQPHAKSYDARGRSEFRHPNGTYIKRDTKTGRFLAGKIDSSSSSSKRSTILGYRFAMVLGN